MSRRRSSAGTPGGRSGTAATTLDASPGPACDCGFGTAACPACVLLGDELDSPRGRSYLINDMLGYDRPVDAKAVLRVDRCLSCLAGMTTCPFGIRTATLTERATMPMLAFWLQIASQHMPSITIKGISVTLHERLKDIARHHHRSLQNEVIACLERYAEQPPRSKAELMAEAAKLRGKLPPVDHDLVDQYKRSGRP